MIVAGIGCKKDTPQSSIETVILLALKACNLSREHIEALATHTSKCGEAGLKQVSQTLGVPLMAFTSADMQGVAARVETVSMRVTKLKGVPSVAEAAALLGAGKGAKLLLPRVATHDATCAIAEGQGMPGGAL